MTEVSNYAKKRLSQKQLNRSNHNQSRRIFTMAYANKSLKKTNSIKIRLSDFEKELLDASMSIHGGETAVWIRDLVMIEVERILSINDHYEASKQAVKQAVHVRH
jgi:hypothetical protein